MPAVVDDRWLVPHFEQMLYDNAQLTRVYAHAWALTGDEGYLATATGVLDYLKYTELPGQWNQRGVIMQVPAGGGTPTQLAATGCYFGNWPGVNHVDRLSTQLTIDQTTGYLYGQGCLVGNATTVTQISPTGNIIEYMGAWYESGFPSGGPNAGVGQNQNEI